MSPPAPTRSEIVLRQPWFAAITTVVGVVAGLLGSIYFTELQKSFPFTLPFPESGKVPLFWGFLVLFGVMFGGMQWATMRSNERSQRELSKNTTDIQETVNELLSLPPLGFLDEFKTYLAKSEYIAAVALENAQLTKSDAAEAIRAILNMVVTLAFLFHKERGEGKSRYAANIMMFKKVEDLLPEQESVKARLKFWEQSFDLSAYQGVLDLCTELSTTTEKDSPEPDALLKPFALAVPKITSTAIDELKKVDLLPGAPFTFATKQVQVFVNAIELLHDVESFNFTPQAKKMINNYFESHEGKQVRSFISIPIPAQSLDPAAAPIGVLNIHRDKDGLFKDKGVEVFAPLAFPFCVILSRLLARYKSVPEPSVSETSS